MARSAEPFTRVPRRLCSALASGDLSTTRLAILIVLLDEADRRKGTATFTLSRLSDALAWEWSQDWLRKQLHRLRADGWVDFESKRGQRAPYAFTLARAAVLEVESQPDIRRTSDERQTHLRQTSDSPQTLDVRRTLSDNGVDPAWEAAFDGLATSDPRARARETETETKTKNPLSPPERGAGSGNQEQDLGDASGSQRRRRRDRRTTAEKIRDRVAHEPDSARPDPQEAET